MMRFPAIWKLWSCISRINLSSRMLVPLDETVVSRYLKKVWCSTQTFHTFLAARWLGSLKPTVLSNCSVWKTTEEGVKSYAAKIRELCASKPLSIYGPREDLHLRINICGTAVPFDEVTTMRLRSQFLSLRSKGKFGCYTRNNCNKKDNIRKMEAGAVAHLSRPDFDVEVAAFVGDLEDFGPGEAVYSKPVFVDQESVGTHSEHDVHPLRVLGIQSVGQHTRARTAQLIDG